MDFEFDGKVVWWRGPTPWTFIPVPDDWSAEIKDRLHEFTFGWGMIPGIVTIGGTRWYTAFFERKGRIEADGPEGDADTSRYMIPIKVAVRRREGIELDDLVHLRVEVLRAEEYQRAMNDPALRI